MKPIYSNLDKETLNQRYESALTDPHLVSLRHEISLLTAHIAQKEAMLENAITVAKWKAILKKWEAHYKLVRKSGDESLIESADKLNEVMSANSGVMDSAKELLPLVKEKRNLVSAEQRRMVMAQQMLTVEQSMSFLSMMMDAIRQAAYLYTSKDEADQIVKHAGEAYRQLTGGGNMESAVIVLADS